MYSRVLYLILINSFLLTHKSLQIVILLHSLSYIFFDTLVPKFNRKVIRISSRMNYRELFSTSSSILNLMSKFSKGFMFCICLESVIKSELIESLDKTIFSTLSRSNYHYVKIINLWFSLYILSIKCVVSKIWLFKKSVHIW
jgi:hypothetical protein